MKKENRYLDKRGDYTAPSMGTADYPKRPENRAINQEDKKK
ncbi:hypothetical protein [Mesobacillus jeotgali]|nr:hypothetical protein [Mesobacillus jeotgali]